MNMNGDNVGIGGNSNNVTIPQSVGALLAEEYTMDPMSALPSFLEMQLVDVTSKSGHLALKSVLEAAISYIQQKFPSWTSLPRILTKYSPEIRLCIHYCMEYNCLHQFRSCASMAESVYALKRSKIASSSSKNNTSESNHKYVAVRPLSHLDKTRSALWLALVPFLEERLQSLYHSFQQQMPQLRMRNSKLKKWFVFWYPYLHMSKEGTMLAYQFAYLLGRTVHYHPSHHFMGWFVRRVTMAEQQSKSMNHSNHHTSQNAKTSLKENTKETNKNISKNGSNARTAILVGVASMLVVGWWANLRHEIRQSRRRWIEGHNQNVNANNSTTEPMSTNSNSIPPPKPPKTTSQRILSPNKCPLCQQTHINPVAATSGYVYCQSCLVQHIRHVDEKCPVTGRFCPESSIFRLYEPTSSDSTANQNNSQHTTTTSSLPQQ